MKHKSYHESFKAVQALEIAELRRCLEAHGGEYDWSDERHEAPIVCVSFDYYVGDVDVKRVWIENGIIKVHASEHDGYADFTFDVGDIMFSHIDFIMDYMEEILTEGERSLICQAVCDLETGNHLLRERSAEQKEMIAEVCEALNTIEEKRDDRQELIVECVKAFTGPNYEPPKLGNT